MIEVGEGPTVFVVSCPRCKRDVRIETSVSCVLTTPATDPATIRIKLMGGRRAVVHDCGALELDLDGAGVS